MSTMGVVSGAVLLTAAVLISCSASSSSVPTSDDGTPGTANCSVSGTYVLDMQLDSSDSTAGCSGQPTSGVTLIAGANGTATISGAPGATIDPTDDGGMAAVGGPAGCSWVTTSDPYACTLLVTCSGPGVGLGTAAAGDSGDNSDSFALEADAQNAVTGRAVYGSTCAWTVTGQRTP
jgi:hypothetical protein